MSQTDLTYISKLDSLLELADETRKSFKGLSTNVLYKKRFQELRARGLSLLEKRFGKEHVFYQDFEKHVGQGLNYERIGLAEGVLNAAKAELTDDQPAPSSTDERDFLHEAANLLRAGNEHLAAVVLGMALEDRLTQLCALHGLALWGVAGSHVTPEQRNIALAKAGVYSSVRQKQLTAWIGLRNSAAHGEHTAFAAEEVTHMLAGIRDFFAALDKAAAPVAPAEPAPSSLVAETPAYAWPKPSPEAQAKTLKNMRKRLRQIKEILAAEDITEAKKLKKIRFVVNLLLPDKEQPDTEKAPA